ncbi:hypothetical protein BT96DRAFT_999087 [Gymnopus androsaceus JB14]|uniref:Uncharacterized protein n=1 Tax=Gymnopus androsaceus JB14 TaxID=1447944 RepID=A0A6A4H9C1_9AGAR|nr:hypothetical protein BT96DRAFT_999087 [Gymnopus androsaceus JB14]
MPHPEIYFIVPRFHDPPQYSAMLLSNSSSLFAARSYCLSWTPRCRYRIGARIQLMMLRSTLVLLRASFFIRPSTLSKNPTRYGTQTSESTSLLYASDLLMSVALLSHFHASKAENKAEDVEDKLIYFSHQEFAEPLPLAIQLTQNMDFLLGSLIFLSSYLRLHLATSESSSSHQSHLLLSILDLRLSTITQSYGPDGLGV